VSSTRKPIGAPQPATDVPTRAIDPTIVNPFRQNQVGDDHHTSYPAIDLDDSDSHGLTDTPAPGSCLPTRGNGAGGPAWIWWKLRSGPSSRETRRNE